MTCDPIGIYLDLDINPKYKLNAQKKIDNNYNKIDDSNDGKDKFVVNNNTKCFWFWFNSGLTRGVWRRFGVTLSRKKRGRRSSSSVLNLQWK